MLKKLRFRLTALSTLLTSCILFVALGITFSMANTQYNASMDTLRTNGLANIRDKIFTGGSLTDVWLAQTEIEMESLVYIKDNETELWFPGSEASKQGRQALFLAATEKAAENGLDINQGSDAPRQVEFSISGEDGVDYYAIVQTSAEPFPLTIILLQSLTSRQQHVVTLAWQYALLGAAGFVILLITNYFLMGYAIAPAIKSLQEQKEFVAAASHELRAPLTTLKASCSLLLSTDTSLQQRKSILIAAESEVSRLSRLVDDLLILASGEAEKLSVTLKPLALDTFCIDLYERYFAVAKEKKHKLSLSLPDGKLPMVLADHDRLMQLCGTILSNALAYTPQNTPIEIRCITAPNGKTVKILIADHGQGISEEDKDKVFRRFYRTDQSRNRKDHFGLGLSVAKELSQLQHAALSIEDTAGGGATFIVAFKSET